MTDETVCVELSHGQATGLIGLLQDEKKRLRSEDKDRIANYLGEIQQEIINATPNRGDHQ